MRCSASGGLCRHISCAYGHPGLRRMAAVHRSPASALRRWRPARVQPEALSALARELRQCNQHGKTSVSCLMQNSALQLGVTVPSALVSVVLVLLQLVSAPCALAAPGMQESSLVAGDGSIPSELSASGAWMGFCLRQQPALLLNSQSALITHHDHHAHHLRRGGRTQVEQPYGCWRPQARGRGLHSPLRADLHTWWWRCSRPGSAVAAA
jgi:hypothetical protein